MNKITNNKSFKLFIALASITLLNILSFSVFSLDNKNIAAEKLVLLLKQTDSYVADFQQKITNSKKNNDITKGKMYSKKPNLFRWEINKPYKNLIISNGKQLFNYDYDLEQVTIQSFNSQNFSSTPFFLSGEPEKLKEEYEISYLECNKNNLKSSKECFKLIPKEDTFNFQYLIFGFEDKFLKELILFDQLGQKTHITFLKPKLNQTINNSLFKFNIPKGVDVIKEEI